MIYGSRTGAVYYRLKNLIYGKQTESSVPSRRGKINRAVDTSTLAIRGLNYLELFTKP
ncbi:unnamed protein product [Arabis nemorensis]|uniref:Uncharacterized protein n=1 Tax=Arabis nemorensis TaxID=586526 RepID=A0A565CCZ5_9BRAS|nr:unnamed protein product [Arabis nemorensis]